MAETRLQIVIQALDRVTEPARRMGKTLGRISKRTGLDRVGAAGREVGRRLGQAGHEALRFGRRVGTAAAVVAGGLFALIRRSAAAGDQIAKTADKLGVGIEALQKLRHAGELAGVETRTFDMALQRFTRRAAEAAAGTGEAKDALAFLGVGLTDAAGNMRPAEDLLADVADAMAGIEDPALRVRIAFKLFDSEGVSMVNMLGKGSEAMREAGREAEHLGIMTEAQARASEKFNDNMTRLMRVVSHLGHAIAGDLMPRVTEWLGGLRELALEARPGIAAGFKDALRQLADMARWSAGALARLKEKTSAWTQALMAAAPWLKEIVEPLRAWLERLGWVRVAVAALAAALSAKLLFAVLGLFAPLAQLAWAIGVAGGRMIWFSGVGVVRAVQGLRAFAAVARPALALAFLGGSTGRLRDFAQAMGGLSGRTRRMARGIGRFALAAGRLLGPLALAARAVFTLGAAFLATPIGWIVAGVTAVAAAAYLIYRNWEPISQFFSNLWANITEAFGDFAGAFVSGFAGLWKSVKAAFDVGALAEWLSQLNFLDIGKGWIAGLADGVRAAWGDLIGWIASAVDRLLGLLPGGLAEKLLGIDIDSSGRSPPRPRSRPPFLRLPPKPTSAAG